MREHEADQTEHLRILVHEVAELMSDNETELVICHEIDKRRVDVHDMRLAFARRSNCPGVDCRVTGDVKIHWISETKFLLDTIKKVMKMTHEPLLNLEAMAFHSAFEAMARLIER